MVWDLLRRRVLLPWAFASLAGLPGVSRAEASGGAREAVSGVREAAAVAIEAQPLAQALAAFTDLTHLQLVYVSQLVLGKVSQGVPAGLPPSPALARLLTGTGLDFLFLNSRTIKLFERPRANRVEAPVAGRTAEANDPPGSLEEVVVSATKRDEFLSAVPMSISVLSAANLEASGIRGISGVAAVTAGVEYDYSSQYGPAILTNIAIRGISSDKGDATTGIYIDDTPIQSPHTTFGNAYPVTFDLAQVEVLRGPQGVLFGRSAEGGAIRFITREPSTTIASQLYESELSVTDLHGTNVEAGAAAGGPLIDGVLGARVSLWYRHDGGYVDHVDPISGTSIDANSNRTASQALRLGLAWEPTDALRITPSFSHQSLRLHDSPVFFVDQSTPTPGDLVNGKLLRQPSVDGFNMGSITVVDRWGAANLTAITSYFDRTATATVDTTNSAGIFYFGGYGSPLGPGFPTSHADAVPTQLDLRQRQLSEEVRLTSADSAARLTWLGGLFYSRLSQDASEDTYVITSPSVPGIFSDNRDAVSEISVFGQTRWSMTPYWSAGAGMRLGWLKNTGSSRRGGYANPEAIPFVQYSQWESLPPTPRFDLSFQPDSRNLFYAAAAMGFRKGDSNGASPAHCGATVDAGAYGPDSVWSFEWGAKNQLFDRRLQLDSSVFYIRWEDIQERVYDVCGNGFTTNVGRAISRGFDLGADALLTDQLHVGLSMGYLDVRYARSVKTGQGQVIVDRGTVVGGVPSVPAPWSGTAGLRYEWPSLRAGTAYVRAEDIVHSRNPGPFSESDVNSISYDARLRADPPTNLVNLQLGLISGPTNVRLFVNNTFNKLPFLQRFADAPGSAPIYAYTLTPRTWGVVGTWNF